MRKEEHVLARLAAIDAEEGSVAAEIPALVAAVQAASPGWEGALERLAACYRRRRLLGYQRETLAWVLTTVPAQRAS